MEVKFDDDLTVIKRVIPQNEVISPTEGTIFDDCVLHLHSDILGEVKFVRKKTQYVENPADGMLVLRDNAASQLTDLTLVEGKEFIRILFNLANTMHRHLGYGYPTISINQQRDCRLIPRKYLPDGTEVKVQTIDQLHAHIFIEDRSGYSLASLESLEGQDLYDHNDPYGVAATEILEQLVTQVISYYGLSDRYTVKFQRDSFPMGLQISVSNPFDAEDLSGEIFLILNEIQYQAYSAYSELENLITSTDGILLPRRERSSIATQWLSKFNLTEKSYRQLYTLIVALKPKISNEARTYLRLIQGPAMTWVLQDGYGRTEIYVTPRIFSRGNAMEVLGVYVENEGKSSAERTNQLNGFYIELQQNIDPVFSPRIGPAVKDNPELNEINIMRNKIDQALSSSPYISETIKSYYIDIAVDVIRRGDISEEYLFSELKSGRHIHEILLRIDEGHEAFVSPHITTTISISHEEKLELPEEEEVVNTNSIPLADGLEKGLKGRSFAQLFRRSIPITSSAMVLDISNTSPKLMVCDGVPYVAVSLRNDKTYLENYYRIAELLRNSALENVSVVPEIAIVRSEGNFYFISKYMGVDYETAILDQGKGHLDRELQSTTTAIENTLIQGGIFFRNLAPRNLIRGEDGKIYVIDFDNVIELNEANAVKVYMKSLNRLAWFADIFSPEIIARMFHQFDVADRSKVMVRTGNFERKFLQSEDLEITLEEYTRIFQYALSFEKRDAYKGVAILGHQLGRFISDYWGEDKEAELTRLLASAPERTSEIRAILYFASKLDQELYLRHVYGLNADYEFLSLKTLEKLKTSRVDISSFFIFNRGLSFEERYTQFIRECGL